mmetsp:Transcript_3223/g.3144  ORF Transcript_3223/g.3144 Transcript_3223/m.3144 type:complete len:209 (-) Transcript_3223:732-1358(-)
MLHCQIVAGEAVEDVGDDGGVVAESELLDEEVDVQEPEQRPILQRRVHQNLKNFQVELGVGDSVELLEDLLDLLHPEILFLLVLVLEGRRPHQQPTNVHIEVITHHPELCLHSLPPIIEILLSIFFESVLLLFELCKAILRVDLLEEVVPHVLFIQEGWQYTVVVKTFGSALVAEHLLLLVLLGLALFVRNWVELEDLDLFHPKVLLG